MAVTAAHHDRRVADPHGLPVLQPNAIFGLKGFAASTGFLRGMNDGVIFDRDVTYPISRTRKPFLSGVAEHRFDLWADVEPLAIDAEFRDVTYGRDLFDEHAVFSFGIGARTLRAQLLGDVVAHANRAAVGQGSNGHFGGDHCSVAVVHGEPPAPFATLFQGFANFRHDRRHIPGVGNLPPRLAQHGFPIGIPHHSRVGRVDINVFPSGIENSHAIHGVILRQRVRQHGIRAFRITILAVSQQRGVAYDGNAYI